MQNDKNHTVVKSNRIRLVLIILLFVIGLNGLGGGYYGMNGAKDVPLEWLSGSPFTSYFVPGLFLFICVGGFCLLAAITLYLRKRFAHLLAIICGSVLLLWIIVQVIIIGYVSWLQPTMLIAGILIILLAWQYHPFTTNSVSHQ
jgi:hypothetical protein